MIDSLRHVQVVGALARLAGNGAWTSILAGAPLDHETDLADAELLVAADLLRRLDDGTFEPCDLHPWYADAEVLAESLVAQLRRALQHGQGLPLDAVDADEIAAMGVASESVAAILADGVLPMLTVTCDRFEDGTARFLDVGVGSGAIADRLCQQFPGVTALGLDVSHEALAAATQRLGESPVGDGIELRLQSVVDLPERDAFDLAWLPQIFLARDDLEAGLARVHTALRSGCWLVMPVAACDPQCSDLERAALAHDAAIRGGGPMSVATATRILTSIGFSEVRGMTGINQTLLLARRS